MLTFIEVVYEFLHEKRFQAEKMAWNRFVVEPFAELMWISCASFPDGLLRSRELRGIFRVSLNSEPPATIPRVIDI